MRLVVFFLLFFGMVVAMLIHLSVAKRPMPRGRYLEIILLQMLFWSVGLIVTITALNELLGPHSPFLKTARELGPLAQKQFHTPVGFAGLTLGILGLLSIYFRAGFWVATVIAILIFNVFQTVLTFYQGRPFDVEVVTVLWDIVGPVVLLAMLIGYRLRAGPERFWHPFPHFRNRAKRAKYPPPPPHSTIP